RAAVGHAREVGHAEPAEALRRRPAEAAAGGAHGEAARRARGGARHVRRREGAAQVERVGGGVRGSGVAGGRRVVAAAAGARQRGQRGAEGEQAGETRPDEAPPRGGGGRETVATHALELTRRRAIAVPWEGRFPRPRTRWRSALAAEYRGTSRPPAKLP